jgi:ribosome-binding protein aMBF1 (putative translation factor)
MKAFTLTDYINTKVSSDKQFAGLYAKQQVINEVAELLIEARKAAHLTQAELAQKIGTTQSVISRIESASSAHVPSLETLAKIACALNMRLKIQLQA